MQRALKTHRVNVEAIRRRDAPAARQAMEAVILDGLERVRAAMGWVRCCLY